MRVAAQIVTATPVMTVTIPVTLKLGINLISGSPPNDVSSGQASMRIPLGAILPCSISLAPWDAPPIPAKRPRIEAKASVTLPLNLRLTMMVTSAVSAMIEPNKTTRRIQSSNFVVHPSSASGSCCGLAQL